MRFVPTFCLREGMLLGDNLYGIKGELMLSRGVVLSPQYISAITRLDFNGLYVEDDLSMDIQIINVINEKVRAKTVKGIKDMFIHTGKGNTKSKSDFKSAKRQVDLIVDDILNTKNLMINMVDMKVFDDYTYYHSVSVAVLSIVIGVALGLPKKDLCDLGFGALLHDIGKVFVNKEILNKEGKLTEEEFNAIKTHPLNGYEYMKKESEMPTSSYNCILNHHEKYSGGGYPNNIKGEAIPLFGRIIALADVYDALTSDRPYRKALLPSEAMEYIMGSTGVLFDPKLVSVFVKKIAPFPIGTLVKLSNNKTGIVLENYEDFCMRPKVRVFMEQDERVTPYELRLADRDVLNITIVEVMQGLPA